jgi:hypothetical protein
LIDEVVEHYAHMARTEWAAYRAAVADWELRRSIRMHLIELDTSHEKANSILIGENQPLIGQPITQRHQMNSCPHTAV